MNLRRLTICLLLLCVTSFAPGFSRRAAVVKEKHYLYVASPGIRNYTEYGGVGVLVYDIDNGYRLVKRIQTWPDAPGKTAENVKGVAASAKTNRLYVTTPARLLAIDLLSEKVVWEKICPGGCDRMALSPDGQVLYVPSFEGPHWNVVNALTGEVIKRIETNSGAHNTIYGPDGARVYLAGLKSPLLRVTDAKTHQVVKEVGPFGNVIRPFTINGSQTLAFVNVNDLLGFEVGDLRTGKMLHRVEVAGYQKGQVKRHGCPSHGIGLTPDEKEIWLCDAANSSIHLFDARQMPPKQLKSIKLRDQPGWVTFSIDGRHAYPSTGEVIDVKTKRIVAVLKDEMGRDVQSEKVVEIDFADSRPVRTGDQFGLGQRRELSVR